MIAIFAISAAITLFVVILISKKHSIKEYTEWEFWKVAPPHILVLPNGEKRFQHQEYWSRYNNITQKWERKTVRDPQILRFEEATHWSDSYNFLHQ
ncbi:hypothetical protein [Mucilaginibacter sp. HD30]